MNRKNTTARDHFTFIQYICNIQSFCFLFPAFYVIERTGVRCDLQSTLFSVHMTFFFLVRMHEMAVEFVLLSKVPYQLFALNYKNRHYFLNFRVIPTLKFQRIYIYIYIYISRVVVCFTTGPKPLPKRDPNIGGTRASFFK